MSGARMTRAADTPPALDRTPQRGRAQGPILVTGIHKAGTTWVGRTLTRGRRLGYVHEPFNLGRSPGVCAAPFRFWYTYICDENGEDFEPYLARTLAFRYGVGNGLADSQSPRDLVRAARDAAAFLANRIRRARPLVKDPLAALSSAWLARTFDMDVVVVLRHPAGFVGSLKIRGAEHPFGHFLAQPLLLRDHLAPLEDEIRRLAAVPAGPVEQGALLWRIVYGVLLEYRRRYPRWTFVRHEDLCADPWSEYQRLFERLGIPFDGRAREWIARSSGLRRGGSGARLRRVGRWLGPDRFIYRNSRAARRSWTERLSLDEVRYVREKTGDIAAEFYGDGEWELPLAGR